VIESTIISISWIHQIPSYLQTELVVFQAKKGL